MYYIAVILFIGTGMGAIAIAVGHEIYWWKRRAWRPSTGIVIDFNEKHGADDGPTYFAVIEFELDGTKKSFNSQYGSGKKPKVGDSVPIVVSSAGEGAAEISQSHRILIPIGFCVAGAICIIVGANIKSIGEQDGGGQPATRSESK